MFDKLELKPTYDSSKDNIAKEFFGKTIKHSISYDRTSAYFSAKTFSMLGAGLEELADGKKYRLIISYDLDEKDYNEIIKGYDLREELGNNIRKSFEENFTLHEEKNISNLAFLISVNLADIKFAYKKRGIFHDKSGILKDGNGNIICFRGSVNETEAALSMNYESLNVLYSWIDVNGFYKSGIDDAVNEFELLWNNKKPGILVKDAPDIIRNSILKFNKGKKIMDETLLIDDAIIFDFDSEFNKYKIILNFTDFEKVKNESVFKHCKSHFELNNNTNEFIFNEKSTYVNVQDVFRRVMQRLASKYHILKTQRFATELNNKNLYYEERIKLGETLKSGNLNLNLMEKYNTFREIVEKNMSRNLMEKQFRDAFFMLTMNRAANFSVPGSGKTSTVLGVYTFLKYKKLVNKIVVISPKNAFGSWITEFGECFNGIEELNLYNHHSLNFKNNDEKIEFLKYDSSNCNLFLFNYESLKKNSKISNILKKNIIDERTLLVLDEVHRMKKVSKNCADSSYSDVPLELSDNTNFKIAMTGTPIPNSYLDLHNMLKFLFKDEFANVFEFDIQKLSKPTQSDIQEINDKIYPFFCRTTKHELGVPPVNRDLFYPAEATNQENELFSILTSKLKDNRLAFIIRTLQLESNPNMLKEKIDTSDYKNVLDISGEIQDIDFKDFSGTVDRLINTNFFTAKKLRCIDLAEELVSQSKKIIIWCIFKDSMRSLEKELTKKGIKSKIIYGEVELNERIRLIEDFKNNQFDVLITNPHTLGESVSLHSVCHDAIYYEYSYNLVHLLQSKDRIHRLGLKQNQYTQYHYLFTIFRYKDKSSSLDETIYARLIEKEEIMLKAIERGILEPTYPEDDEIDLILNRLF